jgi:hypothetical protein
MSLRCHLWKAADLEWNVDEFVEGAFYAEFILVELDFKRFSASFLDCRVRPSFCLFQTRLYILA